MDTIVTFFTDINGWLNNFSSMYPVIVYFLLFSIVYLESAFFPAAPFLPGDGLLMAVGVIASNGVLNLFIAIPVLILAGTLGSDTSFRWGRSFGKNKKGLHSPRYQKIYQKALKFYEKYGNSAFVLSRFMPVIRALVPFVAGAIDMKENKVIRISFLSVTFWVISIILTAFFLGHLDIIKNHFTLIILSITVISLTFSALIPLLHREKEEINK
ncbi:MAG TPA: DedA family protein [Saprospiraceae bacterium]|nr:DedA family protein [Saprospiraceae bacterium]